MTRHDDTASMRHMLDHAREAIVMARGKTKSDLLTDRKLGLAVTRLLEIIGEAAVRVSSATRQKYELIEWRGAIAIRNRLIHGYDETD
jgi:uncharacterized protein with HEPN domain